MMETFNTFRKGIDYCPIGLDNPTICSAGTCNKCIAMKRVAKVWKKALTPNPPKQENK